MPLPFSKTQVRNLGKRLRDATTPAPEDLDLLAEVLAAYGEALELAGGRLSDVGVPSSERLKNTGTIIEKLRRDHATNLSGIQDIAGRRVVLSSDARRPTQDEVLSHIVHTFDSADRPPRVHDRRVTPSRGYRAVHVVVEVLDLPVEIQVRTAAQHEWAEYFARLADVWGRAIRYEDGVPDVERLLSNTSSELADAIRPELEAVGRSMVDHALVLSDVIDFREGQAGQRLGAEADRLDVAVARQLVVVRDLATAFESIFSRLG